MSLLEQARSLHEELEVLERAMYKELGDPSTTKLKRADEVARDQVWEHCKPCCRCAAHGVSWVSCPQVVATLLDAHRTRCSQLSSLYEDNDGARRDEIASMSGSTVFSSFYDQLKNVREYHRKFPAQPVTENQEQVLLTEVLESAPE